MPPFILDTNGDVVVKYTYDDRGSPSHSLVDSGVLVIGVPRSEDLFQWTTLLTSTLKQSAAPISLRQGTVSTLESALLSGLFGNVTSAIGMTIDMLRNIPNRKKYYTPLYNR